MRIGKKHPCSICLGPVAKNQKAIFCDNCNKWCHVKCNGTSEEKYQSLIEEDDTIPFICIKCDVIDIFDELPFSDSSKEELFINNVAGITSNVLKNITISLDNSEKCTVKRITQLLNENALNDQSLTNKCKYYDVQQFRDMKFKKDKYLSVFHLNIASLSFHFEELKVLLQILNYEFDIIAISESKVIKNRAPIIDLSIENYQMEVTETESEKGGTILYVSNKLNYKLRKDLEVYKPKQFECTFIEIFYEKYKNTVVGCMYKHHTISEDDFTDNIMCPLLQKLSKENKGVIVAGDFNMNLLDIDRSSISRYFDTITNNEFLPLVNIPTRIQTKTLIDNILYNQHNTDVICGNLTVGISDHMPQFSHFPRKNKQYLPKKPAIFTQDIKNCDMTALQKDLDSINWAFTHPKYTLDVNICVDLFLHDVETTIQSHAPLKKLTNREYKLQSKPWLTRGILKSIKARDKLLEKILKAKNNNTKTKLRNKYKQHKYKIIKLIRISKKSYYKWYFEENKSNAKKLWKGINEIVTSKVKVKSHPKLLEVNGPHGKKVIINSSKNNRKKTVTLQLM